MEYLAGSLGILFFFIGIALIMHGWPKITVKKECKNCSCQNKSKMNLDRQS